MDKIEMEQSYSVSDDKLKREILEKNIADLEKKLAELKEELESLLPKQKKGIHIELKTVQGKKVIATNDLGYCNTRYHKPYLAKILKGQDPIWQEKVYIGYGKKSETFYCVERLAPNDLIKAAGGSGTNKYPFTGRVIEITEKELVVEKIEEIDFSNLTA